MAAAGWLWPAGVCGCSAGLWRGGGGCLAAAPAGSGWLAAGGAAGVVGLVVLPGGQDALVADGQQACCPEGERDQAGLAAPAAGDAGGGGVFDGGEGAFGAGAPGVGAPPLRSGVVVFLPGLGRDVRGDGDGLLGAAGGRVLRRGEDFGPVAGERHGGGAERAADLARGGRAGDAVVAVGIVAGEPSELVAGGGGGGA